MQKEQTSNQQSALSIQSPNSNGNPDKSSGVDEPARKDTVGVPARQAIAQQDIISAIRELAQKLGRYPSVPELTQAYPAIKMGTIRKYFTGYGEALREAGFEGGGCGYTVTMDALFRDWARLARKFQKCPTMSQYERESRYSVRPLLERFRNWSQTPRGLYGYAEQKELDVEYGDVLEIIKEHYGENPLPQRTRRNTEENQSSPLINTDDTDQKENCQECQNCQKIQIEQQNPKSLKRRGTEDTEGGLDPRSWEARELKPAKVPILPDRPIFGPPMLDTALACGPMNENGVLFLFGSLARQLGFVVMRIQTEFPDCLALRYIGDDRWQLVRIEFEYESRNFLKHMHDPKGCDLIVCWVHNWKECPLEVIELSRAVSN